MLTPVQPLERKEKQLSVVNLTIFLLGNHPNFVQFVKSVKFSCADSFTVGNLTEKEDFFSRHSELVAMKFI